MDHSLSCHAMQLAAHIHLRMRHAGPYAEFHTEYALRWQRQEISAAAAVAGARTRMSIPMDADEHTVLGYANAPQPFTSKSSVEHLIDDVHRRRTMLADK